MSAPVSPELAWTGAGLVLLLAEVLAPGFFMMWLGLAAVGTGAATWAAGLAFPWQAGVAAVLAVLLCAVGRKVGRVRAPHVNTQHSGLIGRRATVLSFDRGEGRVRVGDSDWSARMADGSPPPGAHAALRVVGVAGTVLLVSPAEADQ